MDTRNLHRGFAALAFFVSLVTYWMTVQPTVPFWDCGEFTAAAVQQQVPHPPGAPLYLMLGKLFHMLPIGGDPGWRVNLISVFSNATSILLLYLTIVLVIRNFRKEPIDNLSSAFAVYGSALVGALAYNFSDTFWFNGVESEVYANSSLFVQVIVYLMMKWNEKADELGHERYLLAIAYLIGLSTGVHLLSILAIFSIVYVVYFRKYEFSIPSFAITTVIALVVFAIIYPGIVKFTPKILASSTVFGVLLIVMVIAAVVFGTLNKMPIVQLAGSAILLVFVGYTTYTHILIRSNANPPMNENAPKTFKELIAYLGREQYGDAPNWPRRYDTEPNKVREHRKYGNWVEPPTTTEEKDGNLIRVPDYANWKTDGKSKFNSSEFSFLWKYQMQHMYFRYFGWNFIGRTSDLQDYAVTAFLGEKKAEEYNFNNGYKNLFPVRFFALPFLLGLIGFVFHSQRDTKMFWVFLVMFLMMGILATIQQNQQNPQPRERDYFYAGSFMVWCLWIGMGAYSIIEMLTKKVANVGISGAVVAACLLAAPVNMAVGGWKIHSRAGNYLPFDYSYNILQSCEPNAILFTNGDNDTFPLWYLQDVAGIRRDVRIVNLSLGNTLWYVDQLKNREPWGAKKIPLTFTDESLRVSENSEKALSYSFAEPTPKSIPLGSDVIAKFTNDQALIARGTMDYIPAGQPYPEQDGKQMHLFRVQDKLVHDIIEQVKFSRPVYYSITVGGDAFAGLQNYLRLEGMAYRVCPVPQTNRFGQTLQEDYLAQHLLADLKDDEFYTDFHRGMKFRGLNNPNVYFDEVHRRYLDSYRTLFLRYAQYMQSEKKDHAKAVAALDKMMQNISPNQFPIPGLFLANIMEIYLNAGAKDKAQNIAKIISERNTAIINNPNLEAFEDGSQYDEAKPLLLRGDAYAVLGEFEKAKLDYQALYPSNDPRLTLKLDELAVKKLEIAGNVQGALTLAEQTLQRYQSSPIMQGAASRVLERIMHLRDKMGIRESVNDTAMK